VLGHRLRALRAQKRETLAETAGRAGISPQYLSEIERGRKEPSSEMIAALAGALDTSLIDLTTQVTEDLRRQQPAAAPQGRMTVQQARITVSPGQTTVPQARAVAPVLLCLAA
jgi:transcriptional regulator with XRE-family HTH domain